MKQKHILIITHRRSGTHLTIDLIRNNFFIYGNPYVSVKELLKADFNYATKFTQRLDKFPRIFKSHSDIDFSDFHIENKQISRLYEHLLDNARIIYVYRDPKDVLTSLYYHYLKYSSNRIWESINDFVFSPHDYHINNHTSKFNKIEYWKYHVEGWLYSSRDILFLSYEEILLNYYNVIKKLSLFLNISPKQNLNDVRLQNTISDIKRNNHPVKSDEIYYTTESFRKGEIGNYLNHINNTSIREIDRIALPVMDKLLKL